MQPIGLFGGTFDPIHLGHLGVAADVHSHCKLASIIFVPAANPPLRSKPVASAEQRLEMVKLAISGDARFSVDDRELKSAGPSYSVMTLQSFRDEYSDRSLCLLVGIDAFLHIEKWYQWRQLFELAHIVVMRRPGFRPLYEQKLDTWLQSRCRSNPDDLKESRSGYIYFCNVGPYKISASEIRNRIASGDSVADSVPARVLAYIDENGLYR